MRAAGLGCRAQGALQQGAQDACSCCGTCAAGCRGGARAQGGALVVRSRAAWLNAGAQPRQGCFAAGGSKRAAEG